MPDSPFRIPAELSNTIEPKSEKMVSQQLKQRQIVDPRDAPVGEVPDFLSGNTATQTQPHAMPVGSQHQGYLHSSNILPNPLVPQGSRPNIPLPVEALGHFGTMHDPPRGMNITAAQAAVPSNNLSKKVNPESSGSSSSHHKHSKEKKKKKDKKKHKHKDKERERKKSKKHDKERKRKLGSSVPVDTKHANPSLHPVDETGISETSAQGLSSGSSSCGSPSDSPKRIKMETL